MEFGFRRDQSIFAFGDTRETHEKRKEEFDHSSEFQGVISRESRKRVKE